MKSMISGWIYNVQGKGDLGYRTSDEAMRIAEESGDIYSKAGAYVCHGISCYVKGLLEEAEGNLSKGIDYCQSINFPSLYLVGSLFLGETYFDSGEYKKSQVYLEKAIPLVEEGRFLSSWMNLHRIALARAKVMNNEVDINLTEIFKWHEGNRVKQFEGWMSIYIGEILLNIDEKHMSEAEDWIKKAIEADKRNGMMFYLGKDYALYAELFKRKGDALKVKENLNQAIDFFKECGADGWVEKAEKELKAISRKK